MFLFTTESAKKIRQGIKTQTRRLHLRPRALVGSEHWAQRTLRPDSRFARLKDTSRLGMGWQDDVR